jgi:cyclic beta-1,2-glucan synthetase
VRRTTGGAVPLKASSPHLAAPIASEDPIRAELFGVERLEQHARSLAEAQTISVDATRGRRLTTRVLENSRALVTSYREIARSIREKQAITPAAEWLVDNFHIVDEQIREIRDDLPAGFYRQLPKLADGHLQGYPRVYGVAWAFVAHTDSRFDPELLRRFVVAYQKVQPLTIGELWAVAITLRVVLVENLRRLAERIVRNRAARQEADLLADSLLQASDAGTVPVATVLGPLAHRPLPTAFAVQLVQRLRDLDPKVRPMLLWLDERLAEQNTTADEVVRAEHQRQAASSATVRNIITSMRLMSAFDWPEFFESVSLVDDVLRAGSEFADMDFATRDRYRHAIEELARGSSSTEIEVAEGAVRLAADARKAADAKAEAPRETDPGFFLVASGRARLEGELHYRVRFREGCLRTVLKHATPAYLGSLAVGTAAFLAIPLLLTAHAGVPVALLVLLGALGAMPASDLAIALVHRAVTHLFGPRLLPRLELAQGVPESMRTLVVMPTLLGARATIEEQVERLEVHFLSNPDGDLRFALLSDWTDASAESLPADEELLACAARAVARLNERHGEAPGGGERFLLLHRHRRWNPGENRWMGWERKRGKLHELNRLLRGATDTTFVAQAGRPPDAIPNVRYVLTLDADTRLPRGAAGRLIGTLAHPLNRPRFDATAGRVVDGHAIVQPRITPSLPTDREGSLYQKVFSGPCGLDPYASAVSDVYQDLFLEGSYTGKGIYDVDAFEAALAGRVPENAMLSHDLFEGIFARAALASDIELIEEYPNHFEASAARQHRWARGDWQLLPWLLDGGANSPDRHRAAIPTIGRWKMFDNLRRTLSAPASLLTLAIAWMVSPAIAWIWTAFVLATLVIPSLLAFVAGLWPNRRGISLRSHVRGVASDLAIGMAQFALGVTFLAYHAWLMADAIARTLARLWVSRRNLLEWVTAAETSYAGQFALTGTYRRMAGSVLLGAGIAATMALTHRGDWAMAAPFLVLWTAAPWIASWISLPPRLPGIATVAPDDRITLRTTARRTWRFFETFVTEKHHALPPDNFQEEPEPVVAHRTSPTNIGLYLLSTLSAHDFGWIGALEATERWDATLATLAGLEQMRGHFFNWYDTLTLAPLEPRYVSSVDSGNLAGHLLALSNGCRELAQRNGLSPGALAGINDALRLLREALAEADATSRATSETRERLRAALATLSARLETAPASVADVTVRLADVSAGADAVASLTQALADERAEPAESETRFWAQAMVRCARSHVRDAAVLLPWSRLDAASAATVTSRFAAASPEWSAIAPFFTRVPALADAPEQFEAAMGALERVRAGAGAADPGLAARCDALIAAFEQSSREAAALTRRLSTLARHAERAFHAMDFGFLYDRTRKLISIGYRVADNTLDEGFYDLLASEARLTSFIAIAKGDVPSTHWFRLGRALTPVSRGSALVSWSGSMFEYLMPELVLRSPAGSLLRQSCERIVSRQISYGVERHVPWGVSESAYSTRDLHFTYQYSNFGVPGLGLKRGLRDEIVIAPYATALAAMVRPGDATRNFTRLRAAGGSGTHGYYEALDYTAGRLPEGQDVAIVRAYMAHHQGMTVVALGEVLNDGAMRARFHSEPIVQATELLLQERTPRDVLVARPRVEKVEVGGEVRAFQPAVVRGFTSPHEVVPRTHLLSNGRYAVMLSAAGSGYSRWRGLAVTRWREDATRDEYGSFIFLRDRENGRVWSAGHQPAGVEADAYEACFSEDHGEISRRDRALTTLLEVYVSSEDDAEVRRVSVTNFGTREREIEFTSYAELVLATQEADLAHAAFSNLFVQTEFVPEAGALLATRRRRSENEMPLWAAQVLVVEGETVGELEYETDRARFLGRGRGVRDAVAMTQTGPLSNTVGSVLDPMLSLRRVVRVPPGGTVRVVFSTLVAAERDSVLELVGKYGDAGIFERTRARAWTQAQVQLHHLGIRPDEANVYQRLANGLLFSDPSLRPSSEVLGRGTFERSELWVHGISGDRPIVLARIDDVEDIALIRELLRAHEYWRTKQLSADVVIINEHPPSYAQELQNALSALVRGSELRLSPDTVAVGGGIFLLRAELLTTDERALLQRVARVVLLSRRGTLAEQVGRAQRTELRDEAPPPPPRLEKTTPMSLPVPELEDFNGFGGFADKGRQYVAVLAPGVRTPRPWSNVIANPAFGFLATEAGSGFTWSLNSHENRLTPWSNDAVTDAPGEALYLRDEATGDIWTPTALPVRDENATYVVHHGHGYSRFRHDARGIAADLVQFVAAEDPIKISRLVLRNLSARTRRLSVTAYVEWVLGEARSASAPHVVTELDPATQAILARSSWVDEFAGRVAFADLAGQQIAWTADRTEFLGRNGTLARPRALEGEARLSGRVGAGIDPCAALQTRVEIPPGGKVEIVFFLGQTEGAERARALIERYRAADLTAALRTVTDGWDDLLDTVQITTPDPAMDRLMNRWLLYQTLSCRIYARAAFYQAGGAYGFRDQLQDGMALSVVRPALTRAHLLRAAARQFVEGDVQHWWHPPSGRGVRTRFSDDLLWLPYAVAQYVEVTGDAAVLNERVPFLEGEELVEGQEESYFSPRVSAVVAPLYEHCARALDRSLAVGRHGLPLMGTGDWNDGMNRVGRLGAGESVWLGWFLHANLAAFAPIAAARADHARADLWRRHASELATSIEREAWDGDWYLRAWFDDGAPLGSHVADECRIDSIAQSWAVMSGGGAPERARRAMAAVEEHLVREEEKLILLFTPPFDRTPLDPGYIKGYVPGVRENGGQYTHAAVWTVFAAALLGDGDRAAALLRMLNPLTHTATRADAQRYGAEPYVVAADVYAAVPHVGRGGWTWYTGAAGWLHRAGLESILGFQMRGNSLRMNPCIPRDWPQFEIRYRHRSATYEIQVVNPHGVSRGVVRTELDGGSLPPGADIALADDGRVHRIRIELGQVSNDAGAAGAAPTTPASASSAPAPR